MLFFLLWIYLHLPLVKVAIKSKIKYKPARVVPVLALASRLANCSRSGFCLLKSISDTFPKTTIHPLPSSGAGESLSPRAGVFSILQMA